MMAIERHSGPIRAGTGVPWDHVNQFILLHSINIKHGIHAIDIKHGDGQRFDATLSAYLDVMDKAVGNLESDWRAYSAYIGVCNIIGLHQYGLKGDLLGGTQIPLPHSKRLAYRILNVALQRVCGPNVLLHLHVWLVFISCAVRLGTAMRQLEVGFPWEALVNMLNSVLIRKPGHVISGERGFPRGPYRQPLPEDYCLRGFGWAREYFPVGWFGVVQWEGGNGRLWRSRLWGTYVLNAYFGLPLRLHM
ncbi:hypothetical protein L873DRAFT_1810149 [Choiromyces venosus 120613-1]|uniref:Uncharacterized protein n=1 Tax=Choiromyces venosus 120613-1 TaxID=1336337 RepID=A0A3N4JFQ5_9PEZI|nr:hypothetical protein L873DRAFT_1810149 [Choiromyces venosus 120613-1]